MVNRVIYTVYTEQQKPADFSFTMEGAGCCIIVDEKILLLQRSPSHKIQPGTWGIPAGKVEVGETPTQAALRELKEESGIVVNSDALLYRGHLYITVEYAVALSYRFHVYAAHLQEFPAVVLEHDQVAFCCT